MLKKSLRLNTAQVSAIMEKGRVFHSPLFTLRVLNGQKTTGFAVIMSKKVSKTAVARNLARRRVYEALATNKIVDAVAAGTHIAVLCSGKVFSMDLEAMSLDMKTLFNKAHVI